MIDQVSTQGIILQVNHHRVHKLRGLGN